jgi:hypothetical protein
MYAVIVQDDTLAIEQVIQCDNMKIVQETLETIQPFMDCEYLIVGEASSLTFGNKTYSFLKLENANCLLANQY